MGRNLSEIYNEAKEARDARLELSEITNPSKMSVLDAFTWVVAACIWTFENILDVFQVDIAEDINSRINGTPSYYANALLKYQHGDSLSMNSDGTAFSYESIDESKRIITKISYSEVSETGFYDSKLLFKVAKGEAGDYERLSAEELVGVKSYLRQIAFAGTHIDVVSRKGDILLPKVEVFYDGTISEEEIFQNVQRSLQEFIENVDFNGVVYINKIVDAIFHAEHVVDVFVDPEDDTKGIFVVMHDDDDTIIMVNGSSEQKITRSFVPNSGFLKESTGQGEEKDIPEWKDCIKFTIEA